MLKKIYTYTYATLPKAVQCVALLLWLPAFVVAQSVSEQPNILWLTYEDTSPQFIGCYGNASASTPTIDKLAREGVRFTQAFSNGTVCSPSRHAIITGCRTNVMGTGHHRSNYPIPSFVTGFPTYLRQAGYYTTNNSKTDYNTSAAKRIGQESWNENSDKAGWWNRKPGQPFFAVFNSNDPHQSRTMTFSYKKYEDLVLKYLPANEQISPDTIPLPPFYRDSPEMRKQHARIFNSLKLTDNHMKELLDRLQKEGLLENTIIFCFADHGEAMLRGKTNGIGLGYRVPFIIWFPEKYKHLSPWKTGSVSEELISFEDLAPTLLSLTNQPIPDYLKGRPFLGSKRKPASPYLFMNSDRSDESLDLSRTVTDGRYVFSRVYYPYFPEKRLVHYQDVSELSQQAQKDYKAGLLNAVQAQMYQTRQPEYLYDLQTDPWEIHNLAQDPAQATRLKQMQTALNQQLLAQRDILFLPEYEMDSISASTTPYDYRLIDKTYPFAEILAVANLVGKGKTVLSQQLKLVRSPNPIIRYWAAVGLRAQPQTNALKQTKLRPIFQTETYTPAKILLADILYGRFKDPNAKKLLESYARSSNEHLALAALQAMQYMENGRAKDFLPVVKEVYAQSKQNKKLVLVTDFTEVMLYNWEGFTMRQE